MRRLLVICLLCVLIFAVSAYADNAKRIAEIETQQKQIIIDIQALQEQRNAIDQQITAKQQEFLKLQGAKEELQRQDEAAKKASK